MGELNGQHMPPGNPPAKWPQWDGIDYMIHLCICKGDKLEVVLPYGPMVFDSVRKLAEWFPEKTLEEIEVPAESFWERYSDLDLGRAEEIRRRLESSVERWRRKVYRAEDAGDEHTLKFVKSKLFEKRVWLFTVEHFLDWRTVRRSGANGKENREPRSETQDKLLCDRLMCIREYLDQIGHHRGKVKSVVRKMDGSNIFLENALRDKYGVKGNSAVDYFRDKLGDRRPDTPEEWVDCFPDLCSRFGIEAPRYSIR